MTATTLALSLLVGSVAHYALTSTSFGEELEYRSVDQRFEWRGTRPAPDDIVVLGIDNETDEAINSRFPYPRALHADAIRAIRAAGAKAIIYDIQFIEGTDPANDRALIEAARESQPVVFATAPETRAGGTFRETTMPFQNLKGVEGDALAESGGQLGIATVDKSSDDVVRWIKPSAQHQVGGTDRELPSLALAGLAVAEGRSSYDYKGLPDEMMLNYTGPASGFGRQGGFTYLNYSNALTPDGDLSQLKGKIVLVGATSAVLQDVRETPFGSEMPGVEIWATAIENLRERNWLEPAGSGQARLAAVALALLTWVLLMYLPLGFGIIAASAGLLGYGIYTQFAFEDGRVLSMMPPLATGFVVFVAVVTALAIQGLRERRRVTSLFSRYVSPDVVRELATDVFELVEHAEGDGERVAPVSDDAEGPSNGSVPTDAGVPTDARERRTAS